MLFKGVSCYKCPKFEKMSGKIDNCALLLDLFHFFGLYRMHAFIF